MTMLVLKDPSGVFREGKCDASGALVVTGGSGGGGGSSDTTEATQLLVKAAVQSQDVSQGNKSDTAATWYDSAASIIQLLKLSVAAFVGAGSRTYIYTSGVLTSEQWTLFGTTHTKTYGYTNGVLTSESDWV